MKVRIISVFRDKDTHEIYEIGAEREFEKSRAQHLVSLGLVVALEKEKPAKAETKVEEQKVEETVEVIEQHAIEPVEETAEAEPEQAVAEQKPVRRGHRKSKK